MAERPWKKLVRDLTDAGHESPYLERLRARVDTAQAQADLERELVQEMAAALGRTEEKVNAALLRLELAGRDLDQASAGPERKACLARSQRDHAHATAFGPGDLLLRAKYRVVHDPLGDLAAGLVLRVPTGNEDNFQGTGVWEVSPALYGSTRAFAVGETVRLQAYANAAVDLDAADVGASEARFGLGLDCAVGRRFTGAIAFLAREPFTGIAPPGFFDVQRVDRKTGLPFRAPILGFDRARPSYYDLSLGGRVMLWRDTLIGFVNVLLPLNDDGFRSDVIPLAGIEAAF